MKVSVVLSTYNGSKYIIEQLNSLKKQTRLPDEVSIYDDCSTDNTYELVYNFIADNNLSQTWNLKRNNSNKGWKKNFIDGIKRANGDIIFPCDQDDIWRSDKIEIMEDIMKKNSNISVLTSNFKEFYSNGHTSVKPHKNNKKVVKYELSNTPNIMFVREPGCTYCIRKEFFNICEMYWTKETPHDALVWRMALVSNGLYVVNDDLIKWRKYRESTFTRETKSIDKKDYQVEMIGYTKRTLTNLRKYLKQENNKNITELGVINSNLAWIEEREKFYNEPSLYRGAMLFKYIKFYSKWWQYVQDFYYAL